MDVLAYLDGCAEGVERVAREARQSGRSGPDLQREVARVFGFDGRQPIREFLITERREAAAVAKFVALARRVGVDVKGEGLETVDKAVQHVAQTYGVSPRTIERDLKASRQSLI